MNWLESLVTEWYRYNNYFVKNNVRTRIRKRGGYDVEIDVLAYQPSDSSLIHIETSGSAAPWKEIRDNFLNKKFVLTDDEYEKLIGINNINRIEKLAIAGYSKTTRENLNWRKDIKVKLIREFLREIKDQLIKISPNTRIIPEQYPLLRTMQMTTHFLSNGL